MAYLTVRKLRHDKSQEWMETMGFVNLENISDNKSKWMCGGYPVEIPCESIICDIGQLFYTIHHIVYREGVSYGKKTAVEKIRDHLLYKVVMFEPPKIEGVY
jgi:hypothetical protein